MANPLPEYSISTLGLALGAMVVGFIVRVGLLTQSKTHATWRSFFKRS
jgi:hypothetical protein